MRTKGLLIVLFGLGLLFLGGCMIYSALQSLLYAVVLVILVLIVVAALVWGKDYERL